VKYCEGMMKENLRRGEKEFRTRRIKKQLKKSDVPFV